MKKLIVVMPCYNEEEMLPISIKKMSELMKEMIASKLIAEDSQVCLVNDGSSDKTWEIISEIATKDKMFAGINLSRNFGHQGALLAGLYSGGHADMYVTIDADLQDNPECIKEMVEKHNQGFEIVYGVRDKRTTDTFFKKWTALCFYKLMSLLGVNIVYNHADFRLMSKRAVATMKQFGEHNLFLRAIVPLVGYKSCNVYYDRAARVAGESKYPLKKMLVFAWNGITSFSIVPLRLVTLIGILTCIFSVGLLLYTFYRYFTGGVMPGWTSLITVITFFSGVILLSLGIIGEYMGRVFTEVKARPLYIIDEKINFD
jgi:glycosyltransferase involved in cell wall biosynthesis